MIPRWLSLHGRWLGLGLGALAPALLGGCDPAARGQILRDSPRHVKHVEPAPPVAGTYVNGWIDAQVFKAEADKYVIYSYEWAQNGPLPGPWGSAHLRRIAAHLHEVPFNVLIEESPGNDALNSQRREFVVGALRAAGIPDPERRVVVGFSDAGHLYGEEIEPLYQGYIRRSNGGGGGGSFPGSLGGGVPGFGTPPFVPITPSGFVGGFGR